MKHVNVNRLPSLLVNDNYIPGEPWPRGNNLKRLFHPLGNNLKLLLRGAMRAGALLLLLGGGFSALEADEAIGLMDALRLALAENPSVRSAAWSEAAAGHRVGEARSGLYPQVSVSAGYTRYELPMTVTPIHQQGKFPTLDDQIYDAGVQLSLPILNGRISAGVDIAKSAASEASAAVSLVRLETMARVAGIFIAGRELADTTKLMDAHIEALRQRHRELQTLLAEGRVSPAEISLVESSLDTAASDRIALENRELELALNLGRLIGTGRPVRPKPVGLKEEALNQAAGTGSMPETGPAVLQAAARVEAAEYGKSAALRSLWPELNGFAAYSWRSGSDRDFSGEWAAGLSLRIPLFDAARRWSSIRAAEAGLGLAQSRYREAQITEEVLAEISREKQKSLRNRRNLLSGAARKKETSVDAFRERYSAGRLSLSELLSQEAELLQLRMQERSLEYQRASAYLEFHVLRGSLTTGLIKSVVEE